MCVLCDTCACVVRGCLSVFVLCVLVCVGCVCVCDVCTCDSLGRLGEVWRGRPVRRE